MKRETSIPMKQGIVMHPCPLIRSGLLCFFRSHFPHFTFQTSDSFSKMSCLPGLIKADLVVSNISDDDKHPFRGADWLAELQPLRGDKPSVVLAEEWSDHPSAHFSGHRSLSLIALQTPETVLIQQLHQVLAGKQVISPLLLPARTAQMTQPGLYVLTNTELRVFELLHAGYSVTQIAGRLGRNVKTVSTHKRHIMRKLRVDNEIALFSRVKNLNEKICCLDNGQQFMKVLYPGAP